MYNFVNLQACKVTTSMRRLHSFTTTSAKSVDPSSVPTVRTTTLLQGCTLAAGTCGQQRSP